MSDELDYLRIIDSNLKEIVSPFSSKLSFKHLNFTPKEIMISDLIKDGKQDKDIMEILNISLDSLQNYTLWLERNFNGKKKELSFFWF